MSDLFIDYTKDPLLEQLTSDYRAVQSAIALVVQRIADLKQTRGQRLDRNHPDARLYLERERAHEVAYIRLKLDAGELLQACTRLHATRLKVIDEALPLSSKYFELTSLAQNNLICAELMCEAGAFTYYSIARRELKADHLVGIGSAIARLFREPAPSSEPREFVVKSAAHGSSFRFDGIDGDAPPPGPYLTLSEARSEAAHWEGLADTVGGAAQIYNVRTREIVRR